jgi:hypothetical protein
MPDGNKGGYPDDWNGKSLKELANEDGTYGKLHTPADEVELFLYVMNSTFSHVAQEVYKQIAKWGIQDHPSFRNGEPRAIPAVMDENGLPTEEIAKDLCESMHAQGVGTWCDILIEELAEAATAARQWNDPSGCSIPYPDGVIVAPEDPEQYKEVYKKIMESGADAVWMELRQVAAVAFSWLTVLELTKNREVVTEEHKEYVLRQKWFNEMREKTVKLMAGQVGGDVRPGDPGDEGEEFIPGGYI